MSGPHGFIPVEIGTLRKATEAWFAEREARITAEREKMLRELMIVPYRSWPWSRKRFLTRNEAIKALKTSEDFRFCSRWARPEQRDAAAAEHIAEVGLSVRHIRHPHNWVYLSTRTVALLHKQLAVP